MDINNENNFFKYSKDYKIKELFLKRLKLDSNTEIQSLDDISKIQIAFSRKIPFDNTDILLNGFKPITIENIIKRVLIDNLGSYCVHLNIIFGLFLFEMGIDVRLIKGIEGTTLYKGPWFQYHIGNIINWENKLYLVDVGFGCISPFKPLELLNKETINNNNKNNNNNNNYNNNYNNNSVYRVRKLKNDNDEYLYEEKLIEIQTQPQQSQNQLYNPIFHFNLSPVTYEIIEYYSKQYSNCGIDKIVLIKLFKKGNYHLFKDKLIINYNNNQVKKEDIKDNITFDNYCKKLFYKINK
ncbi:hypothetical protein ACTFIV_001729 [Dictyostelium citrinum]